MKESDLCNFDKNISLDESASSFIGAVSYLKEGGIADAALRHLNIDDEYRISELGFSDIDTLNIINTEDLPENAKKYIEK